MQPKVTIGIPTYNRSSLLKVALESALQQTYQNLEILVCDNASTDSTPEVVQTLAQHDCRIKYVRRPENIGASGNFFGCLTMATGEYFLWLADDDFYSQEYVARCIDFLAANPGYVLATGLAVPHPEGCWPGFVSLCEDFNQERAVDRCLLFYRMMLRSTNNLFYGVARMDILRKNVLYYCVGNDTVWSSQLCLLGKVKVIPEIRWHFRRGGESQTLENIARAMKLSPFFIRFPALNFALGGVRGILWSPIARQGGRFPARLVTAIRVFFLIVGTHNRFPILRLPRKCFMQIKFMLFEAIKKLARAI